MAQGSSFELDVQPMLTALTQMPPRLDRAVEALMHLYAARGEAAMKTNARWTDRTSNARNGLFTKVIYERGRRYGVTYAHSVPYGIWLEVRWSGRYAIIQPTMAQAGPQIMGAMNGIFRRL